MEECGVGTKGREGRRWAEKRGVGWKGGEGSGRALR